MKTPDEKLEAAANDFTHKVGLKFLARKQYNVAVDSFIAGAEWALREAIGILKVYKLSSNAIHELEQILSKDGEQ